MLAFLVFVAQKTKGLGQTFPDRKWWHLRSYSHDCVSVWPGVLLPQAACSDTLPYWLVLVLPSGGRQASSTAEGQGCHEPQPKFSHSWDTYLTTQEVGGQANVRNVPALDESSLVRACTQQVIGLEVMVERGSPATGTCQSESRQ